MCTGGFFSCCVVALRPRFRKECNTFASLVQMQMRHFQLSNSERLEVFSFESNPRYYGPFKRYTMMRKVMRRTHNQYRPLKSCRGDTHDLTTVYLDPHIGAQGGFHELIGCYPVEMLEVRGRGSNSSSFVPRSRPKAHADPGELLDCMVVRTPSLVCTAAFEMAQVSRC